MQTVASPARFVVDASVVMKWHLRDEQHVAEADAILADLLNGNILLVAPDHLRYEVPNAIRTAVLTNRLTALDGQTAIEAFFGWQLPTAGGDGLIMAAYDIALRFGCALYDGLYLALADLISAPLVHADRRLHNTLAGRFQHELWIEDYETAP
jgi:predicted nucleic acid-binding protein